MNILKLILDLQAVARRGVSFGPYEGKGILKDFNCYVTDGAIIFLVASDLKVNAGGLDENGAAVEKDPIPIDKVLDVNDIDLLLKEDKTIAPKIEILKTIDWEGSRGSRPMKLSVFKGKDGSKTFINHGYYKLINSLSNNTLFMGSGPKVYFTGDVSGVLMAVNAPELDKDIQVNPVKRKKMHKSAKKNPSAIGTAAALVAGAAIARKVLKKNPVYRSKKTSAERQKIWSDYLIELEKLEDLKKKYNNVGPQVKKQQHIVSVAFEKYDDFFSRKSKYDAPKKNPANNTNFLSSFIVGPGSVTITGKNKKKVKANKTMVHIIGNLMHHYTKEGKKPGWFSPLSRGLISGSIKLDDRFKNQKEIAGDLQLLKISGKKSGHTWTFKI